MGQTIWRSLGGPSETAGPFDKLRAGSSTRPLAMRLRAAPLRNDNFDISSSFKFRLYRYTMMVGHSAAL